LAQFDVPARLVVAFNYELPIGPGKPAAGGVTGAAAKILGGWQINGIMAYLSSPLWLLLLLLSTIAIVNGAPRAAEAGQAVPFDATKATLLFAYVMSLLLLPKVFGLILLFRRRERLKAFGGAIKTVLSAIGEALFSIILAPVLMLFFTRFVWDCFTGGKVTWGNQKRVDDTGPSWRELFAAHSANTLFVLAWTALIAWVRPGFLPWMAPIFIGPLLAIPFSRMTASVNLGQRARKSGLFLIPEETEPLLELQQILEPFAVPTSPFFRTRERG
jgi:membrane glycosyltransferase